MDSSDDVWENFGSDFPEFSGLEEMFQVLDATNLSSPLYTKLTLGDVNETSEDCTLTGHCTNVENSTTKPPEAATTLEKDDDISENDLNNLYEEEFLFLDNIADSEEDEDNEQEKYDNKEEKIKETEHELPYILHTEEDEDYVKSENQEEEIDNLNPNKEDEKDNEENEDENEEEETDDMYYQNPYIRPEESQHTYYNHKRASVISISSTDSEEEIDISVEEPHLNVESYADSEEEINISVGNEKIDRGTNSEENIDVVSVEKQPINIESSEDSEEEIDVETLPESENEMNDVPEFIRMRIKLHNRSFNKDSDNTRKFRSNKEKQRRSQIKNDFQRLKLLVPKVIKQERCSKVMILQEATRYCDHLKNLLKYNACQINYLKMQREKLSKRLLQLKQSQTDVKSNL